MSCEVLVAFDLHWPFFTFHDAEMEGYIEETQKFVDGLLLTTWLAAAAMQWHVKSGEGKMRLLAYSTSEDDQARFTQLMSFRRVLGTCYDNLSRMRTFASKNLRVRPVIKLLFRCFSQEESTPEGWLQGGEELRQPLFDFLEGLEEGLDAMKEDLNEEIQVTIGTVQVRDAQLMKEQAKVAARQTTWTVALTVLAAAYLPMTLVTGIFGMNITEISSEATAPHAWWVLVVWMIIVLFTVAGISLYVFISRLRAKKKSDLEANDRREEGTGEARQEESKGLVTAAKK